MKRGFDQSVEIRVPAIFPKVGLQEITVRGAVHLLGDYRRGEDERLEQLKTAAAELEEVTARLVFDGGMSCEELEEFRSIALRRMRFYSEDPSRASKSGYIRVM